MISSLRWRAAATAAVFAATFSTIAHAVTAQPGPLPDGVAGDRLTVTVSDGDGPASRGTHELLCHPAGGDHPAAQAACDRLDTLTVWGRDLFAPVPPDAVCTLQYGGPVDARVTGHWAGRPVDARFSRRDGCEIARWDSFVPLLPDGDRAGA
ncbi:SSI family serine proteinase inhibitor [Kitasatospora indigofera]|uniref:SSI family serine proteinase inhibitor n=1 Tax=Kitasatospora indigofera TaxID=67307 RepID=UPI00363FFCB4